MAEKLTLFDLADLAPKPPRPARPPQWVTFPDGPDRSDHEPDGWTGPCLYSSPARGLAARLGEWELWVELYGHFGCGVDSHAWQPTMNVRDSDDPYLDRHDVFLLDCDLRRFGLDQSLPLPPCGHGGPEDCGVLGALLYRSVCRKKGCDWEGSEHGRQNPAVEDGMDHAWPGWRHLPPVPRLPDNWFGPSKAAAKSRAGWEAKVNEVYPDGWLESGGPIRTVRRSMETRHAEHTTPYGGYDLALTCHLCGAAENLTWLTGGGVTVAGCTDGCPEKGDADR
jgi:hypothetical protein